ncbi:MAG: AMP-binding protein [Eggerthellaceae bacterium]|nr:AMP-binding protein [Eggerthellaceae bacterium]
MKPLNEQFIREEYDASGVLTGAELICPEEFCFARDVVDAIALREPDRRAMVWLNPQGDEHIFTFGDMRTYSDKTAAYLSSLGISKGDKVMVVLRRHYQFWFVALALAKIGAVMIPATFMLKEHDLEYRLKAAGISAIIATSVGTFAGVADAVCTSLAEQGQSVPLRIICAAPDVDGAPEGELLSLRARRPEWEELNAGILAAPAEFAGPAIRIDEPMLMYFSSGTSGQPKMVLHNGRYALAHLMTAKHWHGVCPDGLHFTIADTGWGKAVWGKFYGQWIMEGAVLTYDFDRFNADEILGLIQKYRVTTLCCPPTMYRMMMGCDVDSYDLSSLVRCTTAGEALNPDLYDFWLAHTHLKIFEGFGQTETPLTVANLLNTEPKPGSMGRGLPLYDVRVLRDDDTECNPGETGEICVRLEGDAPGIMTEYYRDPERTALAKRDGWYHTGDTAWKDEDGYFWYVGRNDDVIKSSGYRIGPFEIESVMLEHPAVKECAVIGVPDPLRGAVVKAFVVLQPNVAPGELLTKELQRWVKDRTAPYKFPRLIDYVEALPRTTNGKIRRAVLREWK